MVRYFYIFLFSVLCFSAVAANAQSVSFEAYIDRESVSAGETFQIKLELINAVPEVAPDLTVLPAEISVVSQQQMQEMNYINGMQTQNISWVLDLVSNTEGTYKIPAIEVKTSAGPLFTKPFNIYVKSASQISAATSDNAVFIEAQLENKSPYIDEPVLYKASVYHLNPINDGELVKPRSDNAIVEQVSNAKLSRQILNGVNYKMIQVEYLITPLKEGEVVIDPVTIRGKMAKPQQHARPQSQLDQMFDPFGTGSIGSSFINQMKDMVPFTVASKKVTLNVKPADAQVEPWLVLYDLKMDEETPELVVDEKNKRITANAGEPITRKIRLTAYGKSGEALPELESIFKSDEFKVYSDKAEVTKEVIPGDGPIASRIKGVKSQTFTFIPQKSGMLTLPEINIRYFSLKDEKPAVATLPGKVITVVGKVSPNATPVSNEPVQQPQLQQPATEQIQLPENKSINSIEELTDFSQPQRSNLVILALSFFICVIMFVSFKALIQAKHGKKDEDLDFGKQEDEVATLSNRPRKITSDQFSQKKNSSAKPHRIMNFGKDSARAQSNAGGFSYQIGEASSFAEVQKILQQFAAVNLGMASNAASIIIAKKIADRYPVERSRVIDLASKLDSAIYAGKGADLAEVKKGFVSVISQIENGNDQSGDNDKDDLIALNP